MGLPSDCRGLRRRAFVVLRPVSAQAGLSTAARLSDAFKHFERVPLESGKIRVESPSNIALIKYWGKCGCQRPANPSLSFTLSRARTETELSFTPKRGAGFSLEVFLEAERKPEFEPKITVFFERIASEFPFLENYHFAVHTRNSFPHSSGIASSASGISALALALVALERERGVARSEPAARRRASALARLGSGSACRSLYPGLVLWGETPAIPGSSCEYAIPYPHPVHPLFRDFRDTILLIHAGCKGVSSTSGHESMNAHPYAAARFEQAAAQLEAMIPVLQAGDLEAFGALVEREALSLHAIMMTASAPYLLLLPNTVAVLQKVWAYRRQTANPLYFTLDAGANVHLLYPACHQQAIQAFIKTELLAYCEAGRCIEDSLAY